MIRKLLFVIGLLLTATPAFAQNTQCANRPTGDNSNACANTRFVQDAISGGGALPEPANTVFAGPVSGSSATPSFRVLTSNDLNAISSPVLTQTWTFTPTPASLAQGFNISQTVHGTSTSGSSVAYNLINVPSDDADTDGVAGGNSVLKISNNFGGSSMKGSRIGLLTQSFLTAPSSASNLDKQYVAVIGQAAALSNDGGTNTGGGAAGAIFASNFYARAGTGATNLVGVIGGEVDVELDTGSSAERKVGWQVAQTSNDAVQGSAVDAGYQLFNQGGAIGWNDGFLFGDPNAAFPVKSNGNLIRSIGGAAANGTDFSTTVFSGCAFKSNNFCVDQFGNWQAANGSLSGGLVTPLIVAGAATNVSLVLESTVGAGTADSIVFKTGSQVTRWTIDTNGILIGTAAIEPGAGTFSAGIGKMYTDATLGLTITAGTGTADDFIIAAAGGQDLLSNPHGTTSLKLAGGGGLVGFGAGAFAANGSVATVLGSLGPVGSHTTVQKWFKINDGTNTYFIPGF